MKLLKTFDQPHPVELDERFFALDVGNIGNVLYWHHFLELVRDVSGDLVECGVGRGRSLVILCALNHLREGHEGGQRRVYAYDSFEGFPAPTPEDDSPRKPRQGDWSHSPSGAFRYSPELIDDILERAALPPARRPELVVRKGFFGDTLPSHPDRPIAVLHVDGDLYQSYLDTLTNLFPKVAPGGVVIFDDFKGESRPDEKFPGARRAVYEYLGDRAGALQISPGGTFFYRVP